MNYRQIPPIASSIFLVTVAAFYLLIGLSAYSQGNNVSQPEKPTYKEGELIIQMAPGAESTALVSDFATYDLQPKKLLSKRMNIWLYEYDPAGMTAADHSVLLANVRNHRDVFIAQFNHPIKLRSTFPDDPSFNLQWSLHNTGQSGGTPDADIDAPEAWDIATGDTTVFGDQIVVAIIDGGCDINHVDIDFFKNIYDIPGNGQDDDTNGYIDDYDGWNAYSSNGNIPISSHGTHVAGIAAAIGNNATGVSGVNWGVKVMPIAGSSSYESVVVEAYGYVVEMRARYNETNGARGAFVVATNSSFGVDYGDPDDYPIWCAMYDSMGVLGILSAAATANLNIDIDVYGDVPTACPSDFLISVTNTTHNDTKNSSAAYGATTIDLGAPGTNIYSTTPYDNYGYMTGTSMATPHVCGAVALLYAAACPALIQQYRTDPATVALIMKQYILDGTDPIPSLQGITVSGGRLNIYNSLQLVENHPCGVMIEHSPLSDTKDTLNDYEVLCEIVSAAELVPESLLLYYEIASVWYEDTLTTTGGPDEYHGFIPSQAPGTVINYYLYAQDVEGSADTTDTFTFRVIDYGVAMEPTFDTAMAAAEDTVWYSLTVTNTGVYVDDYSLSYSGNSWPTSLWDETGTVPISSTGPLAEDENLTFKVQVVVPLSQYGDADTVEVEARSTGDPSIYATSTLRTISAGAPLAIPFVEDFPSPTIDIGKWVAVSGATVNDVGLNEPSAPYSVNFDGDPNGADTIMSQAIDLKGQVSVIVRYFYQQTGGGEPPDANDDLFVEYLDSTGSWQLLRQHLGSDPDMTEFAEVEEWLPGNAYHSGFRLRLHNTATTGAFDDWFVDDIYVGLPADYAVEMVPTSASQYGPAGDSTWYQLTIHNQGLYADNYDLSDSGAVWPVSFFDVTGTVPLSSVGPIPPADSIMITVKVSIPSEAVMNEADTAEVYAVSQSDPSVFASAVLITISAGGPGAFPWFEPFPTDTLVSQRWMINTGAEVSTDGMSPPTAPYSLNLDGGGDTVVSQLIDLSDQSAVLLSYWYQQGGGGEVPDSGDDLWVEYKNDLGSWVTIRQHLGSDPSMTTFEQVTVGLPDDARHNSFQLRLRSKGSAVNFDDWFVDDIRVDYAPAIAVSPESLTQTLEIGDSTTDVLIITNVGLASLNYSLEVVETQPQSSSIGGAARLELSATKEDKNLEALTQPVWLTVSDSVGELAGGEADTIVCTFSATQVDTGVYHADIVIVSNDPDTADNPRTVPVELTVTPEPSYICGDVDGNGLGPNVVDVTYLVDYLLGGGPPPPVMEAADVDGSGGDPNVADITYLVAYLFLNGPAPVCQ